MWRELSRARKTDAPLKERAVTSSGQQEKNGEEDRREKDARDNVTGLFAVPPIRGMINAVGAVARRMPSAARRGRCWISWCQAALLGASALVIVAERSARKWA